MTAALPITRCLRCNGIDDLIQGDGPVAILLVGIALLFRAFIKGDIVPGHIYLAEREQRQKAETQAERNAEALATIAKALLERPVA